jgi:hypothetical protein
VNGTEFIQKVAQIVDPAEACYTMAEYEHLLGYDLYYGELREALIEMCKRCGNYKSEV